MCPDGVERTRKRRREDCEFKQRRNRDAQEFWTRYNLPWSGDRDGFNRPDPLSYDDLCQEDLDVFDGARVMVTKQSTSN